MNSEDKILELLSETLRKVDKISTKQDKQDGKLDSLASAIQNNTRRIDTLISVVARQNTALQNLARDVNDLKTLKFDMEDLKRRMDELEKYVGKK